mmetsp:Transcript_35507/g.69638  ORF Transcript_35507/g.69638 Transcript_35507/m.69638 type:complete len:88 (+) Transcript_35507:110-373(+)
MGDKHLGPTKENAHTSKKGYDVICAISKYIVALRLHAVNTSFQPRHEPCPGGFFRISYMESIVELFSNFLMGETIDIINLGQVHQQV